MWVDVAVMASGPSAKECITLLCRVIESYGVRRVTPETIRKAKFNQCSEVSFSVVETPNDSITLLNTRHCDCVATGGDYRLVAGVA